MTQEVPQAGGSAASETPLPYVVYAPDDFHPDGIARARQLFRTVVALGDDGWEQWPEHAEGLMSRIRHVHGADIRRAVRLRAIAKQGVGLNSIDVAAARECGIAVCNSPGINADFVAELALGLAISVARRIGEGDRRMRAGEALIATELMGHSVFGRTVGIIGMGHAGLATARIFQRALGCRVVAYSGGHSAQAGWSEVSHERCDSLEELLKQAEILSLHIPLTAKTEGSVGAKQFDLLPANAILINCARGGVVDEAALLEALRSGRLGGAGLDTLAHEPATAERYGSGLYACSNVVVCPHIGAATEDCQRISAIAVAENLALLLQGKDCPGTVP